MGFLDSVFKGATDVMSGGFTNKDAKSLIPGIGDAMAQDEANKLNLDEAKTNREFQERMSNTAYQRAMEDMRKAGLNPTLAFSQGGASSPSGSTATVQSASKTRLADMALSASTGIGSMRQKQTALEQQQGINDSTIKLQAANAAKAVSDAEQSRVQTQKIREETKGLGRKSAEGDLWSKFYKGINNVLDSSAKDAMKRDKSEGPLIKRLGPADKKDQTPWLFKRKS